MNRAILAALLCAALPATAATAAERNFGVSGFDRVRVDGGYRVTLTTGIAPYAKASGSARAIDKVSLRVEGRTLVIKMNNSSGWGGYPGEGDGPVEIMVGTHELSAVTVNGGGAVTVNRVEGLKFDAAAQGAGSIAIDDVEVDQFNLSLFGTASARLGGKAGKATLMVRGISSLDGDQFTVKDAIIGAEGPAVVKVTATDTAKVNAVGVGTVTLNGNPACTLSVQGSATVSGCKGQSR
jgi:hypothetical protein